MEQVSGSGLGISFILLIVLVIAVFFITKLVEKKSHKYWFNGLVILFGLIIIRYFFLNATAKIEEVDPALAGFLGGANLPIIFSWVVGGFFAGGVAFVIGKVALGLRSDYLAIVTLGIWRMGLGADGVRGKQEKLFVSVVNQVLILLP